MKKIKIALVCFLALQLAALGIAVYLFTPKCAYDIRLGPYDVLYTLSDDEKVHEIIDDAKSMAMQFNSINPGGPLPTTPEGAMQSTYVEYIPQLVENSRNRVIKRVFGRSMTRQEVSSIMLEFDLPDR
jgi:hypothetical protein